MDRLLVAIYVIGNVATFVFLISQDLPGFNAWNWLVLIPIDLFLAQIWPIYWGILYWIV